MRKLIIFLSFVLLAVSVGHAQSPRRWSLYATNQAGWTYQKFLEVTPTADNRMRIDAWRVEEAVIPKNAVYFRLRVKVALPGELFPRWRTITFFQAKHYELFAFEGMLPHPTDGTIYFRIRFGP